MRNLLISLLSFTVILNTSCSSENELGNDEFASLQIEQVLNLQGDAQRGAFSLLENDLKFQIWSSRLNEAKKRLNEEQANIIDDLLKVIDIDFFAAPTSENETYRKKINDWKAYAQEKFNREEFIFLFARLDNDLGDATSGIDIISFGGSGSKCECNQFEDFCFFSSCEGGSECTTSIAGCGVLWGSECDGECDG